MLLHRGDAGADRVLGGAEMHLAAGDGQRAAVFLNDPREDLDEGGFSRAVDAEQGVHLARLDVEVHAAQGLHRAEPLRHIGRRQNGRCHGFSSSCCICGPRAGVPRGPARVRARGSSPALRRAPARRNRRECPPAACPWSPHRSG
ncbi:hypothetical protein SDC9_16847 [bioreactor metagenome]|uniref:Uncharacterized protein n=1 Tax=bioreactor metagenome TaxID=1076179 RepID=A0A644TWS7_9ZZZZ